MYYIYPVSGECTIRQGITNVEKPFKLARSSKLTYDRNHLSSTDKKKPSKCDNKENRIQDSRAKYEQQMNVEQYVNNQSPNFHPNISFIPLIQQYGTESNHYYGKESKFVTPLFFPFSKYHSSNRNSSSNHQQERITNVTQQKDARRKYSVNQIVPSQGMKRLVNVSQPMNRQYCFSGIYPEILPGYYQREQKPVVSKRRMKINKIKQTACCIQGCNAGVSNRTRFCLKCKNSFKDDYLENGLDKICDSCYFRDRYVFKKSQKNQISQKEKLNVPTYIQMSQQPTAFPIVDRSL